MCYALPNVDYLSFEFAWQSLPAVSVCDTVCKLCAHQNILNVDVLEASQTSSSTEEDLKQCQSRSEGVTEVTKVPLALDGESWFSHRARQ